MKKKIQSLHLCISIFKLFTFTLEIVIKLDCQEIIKNVEMQIKFVKEKNYNLMTFIYANDTNFF